MASFKELIGSDTPVLVDFYADWCQPCKMMPPVLQELKSRFGDELKIVKVDVEKNQQAANAYQVQGVPTLILFQNSDVKWRTSGVMQADQLEQVIREHT